MAVYAVGFNVGTSGFVGDDVGWIDTDATEGADDGLLFTVGTELELGAGLILGASVISTQLNVPLSNNTQLSKIPSPTSATTILIVFTLSFGVPCAVRIIVNPSGSICG